MERHYISDLVTPRSRSMLQTRSEGSEQLLSLCALIIRFDWTSQVQEPGHNLMPSPHICREEYTEVHSAFGLWGHSNVFYVFFPLVWVCYLFAPYTSLHFFTSCVFFPVIYLPQQLPLPMRVDELWGFDEDQVRRQTNLSDCGSLLIHKHKTLNIHKAGLCPILLSNQE